MDKRLRDIWVEALKVAESFPSYEDSCRQLELSNSARSSFGDIIQAQFPQYLPTGSKVEATDAVDVAVSLWQNGTKRQRLLTLVRLAKKLTPILASCEKKLDAAAENNEENNVTLEELINYARLVAPHARAPPEYSDPTGTDPYCVPGFLFPCPDRLTMSRSCLFFSTLVRAIPPTISFTPDARSGSIYHVEITTPTEGATILYTINNTSQWLKYDPVAKFIITGPGKYIIRAYCHAEGQLASEVSLSETEVPGAGSPKQPKIEQPKTVEEPPKAAAKPKFGGLFIGDDESSDDSSDENSD